MQVGVEAARPARVLVAKLNRRDLVRGHLDGQTELDLLARLGPRRAGDHDALAVGDHGERLAWLHPLWHDHLNDVVAERGAGPEGV